MTTRMNFVVKKWNWMFWELEKEREILIYSPGSYNADESIQEYFVVVRFRLEGKDWWLCQFQDDPDDTYTRVNNYKDQLREAMTTCYAMNKLMGAC